MEQVETKVDVLAVLADYSAQHGDPEDFEQARAAIAELIEAADKLQQAYRLMDADPDFIRLRAALASVGGGK